MRTAITFNPGHEAHAYPGHVERPERLRTIEELVRADGIMAHLTELPAPDADIEDVLLVHPRAYYDRLEAAVSAGGAHLDPDTYARPLSLQVALQALGGLLAVTRVVLNQETENGFAMTRPPGHHARPDEAMGFCLVANVAIAAKWAKKNYNVDKVLIVDFDVHHGNGTQEIFYEDPDVMYMSTHQSPLYPGTGALEETGAGAGKGATINVPLPARTGDAAMLTVFKELLTRIALNFNPDLIFVSAGYDAHWMDPVGGMNLSIAGFADIVREILTWADQCTNHKLVAVLEGGYHADALAHSALTTLRLLQNPNADISDPLGKSGTPDAEIPKHLNHALNFHREARKGDS